MLLPSPRRADRRGDPVPLLRQLHADLDASEKETSLLRAKKNSLQNEEFHGSFSEHGEFCGILLACWGGALAVSVHPGFFGITAVCYWMYR